MVVNVDAAKKLLQSKGIDLTKTRAGGSIQGRLTKALNASKITQGEYDSVFEEKKNMAQKCLNLMLRNSFNPKENYINKPNYESILQKMAFKCGRG